MALCVSFGDDITRERALSFRWPLQFFSPHCEATALLPAVVRLFLNEPDEQLKTFWPQKVLNSIKLIKLFK